MKFLFKIIITIVILGNPLIGQDIQVLNFDESLDIAVRSSFTFKQLESDFRRDWYNLKSQEAGFKSNAWVDFTIPQFSESILEQYNTSEEQFQFVKFKTLRYNSNFRINQPITTGGNFSFNANLQQLDQFKGSKNYFGRLFFEFAQPILQPNHQKDNLERAEIRLTRTRLNYAQRKSRSVSWLTGIFYGLYRFQKQIELKLELLNELETIYNEAEIKVRNNELAETELLQLQVDKDNLDSDLVKLRADRLNREEAFKQQLGYKYSGEIRVADNEEVDPVNVELKSAIDLGMTNRTEVRRHELDLRQRDIEINAIKSLGRLRGDIITTFGFDNTNEIFNHIFQDYNRSRSIVLKLSLPVIDWGKNQARLEEQYVRKEKILNSQNNQTIQIKREISDAYFNLQDSISRLSILTASRTSAERSYRLTSEQFTEGQLSAQELRLSRQRYIDTIDRYLNAFVDYKSALMELNRTTMWDFQNNHSFVTEDEINRIINRVENDN